MENIELSIVVPIYNVENYLRECLESLYNIKNIKKEIILVNDGSTDGSLKIIKQFEEKYPSITKVVDKKNGGLSDARNAGAKLAKGDYIYFIDSDDFVDSLKLEEVFIEGKQRNADVIKGNGVYLKKDKMVKSFEEGIIPDGFYEGREMIKLLHKSKIIRAEVWLSIYKSEFLKKNNITFEKGLIYEDMIFSYKVWLYSNKIFYKDIKFYYYRLREGSIMSSGLNKEKFKHKLKNCKLLLKEVKKKNINISEINNLIVNIVLIGIVKFRYYDKFLINELSKRITLRLKMRLYLGKIFIKLFNCQEIEV